VGFLDDRQVGAEIGVEHAVRILAAAARSPFGPVAAVPGASPKPSPMAARIEGAVCTTDVHFGVGNRRPDGTGAAFSSTKAAVGQTLMHCPH